MSLKVMTWAWTVRLPPAPKFVLMALADEADDHGFCFPSVRHVAYKCTITERSVQRMIRILVAQRYVSVEQRFRKGRAQTSNGYRLAIDTPPTNCQGVEDSAVTRPVTPASGGGRRSRQGAGDASVGVTTTYPSTYPTPPLQPGCDANPDDTASAVGACGGCDFCFPTGLSNAQRQALSRQLARLSREHAQQVLDELAGRMNTTLVRNPIRYCATLADRLKRGEFTPELGLRVAEERRQQSKHEGAPKKSLELSETARDAQVARLPEKLRASLERIRSRFESNTLLDALDGSKCANRGEADGRD